MWPVTSRYAFHPHPYANYYGMNERSGGRSSTRIVKLELWLLVGMVGTFGAVILLLYGLDALATLLR